MKPPETSKFQSMESVNVTLYGQRVLADVIEVKGLVMERSCCLTLVSPTVITRVPIQARQREILVQKKRRQCDIRSRDVTINQEMLAVTRGRKRQQDKLLPGVSRRS